MQNEKTLEAAVVEICDALIHQVCQLRARFAGSKAPSVTSYEDARHVVGELAEYALSGVNLFADTMNFLDMPTDAEPKNRRRKRA